MLDPKPDTAFADMVREAARHSVNPEVSLVAQTIHNPAEPRHYMSLRPAPWRVMVTHSSTKLADTRDALICPEVGKMMYLPVFYLPRSSVLVELVANERRTHCPLKGDASYQGLADDETPIGWSYDDPLADAVALKDRIAFDPNRVSITTAPD